MNFLLPKPIQRKTIIIYQNFHYNFVHSFFTPEKEGAFVKVDSRNRITNFFHSCWEDNVIF